jgi:hypothetical protein
MGTRRWWCGSGDPVHPARRRDHLVVDLQRVTLASTSLMFTESEHQRSNDLLQTNFSTTG